MKKHITLLSGLCLVSAGVFGQVQINKNVGQLPARELSTVKPTTSTASPAKALGVTFWQDDFSTPANWTVDNNGQVGATFGWSIDNTVDGWYLNNFNSTSGGNFAELSNGDPTLNPGTQALNVVYTMTTAAPISLTNGTNVSLSFEQTGARFNDLQEILISTDGTNFTAVGNNLDKEVLSQSGGAAYGNPEVKSINLSTYLSGQTQVWLRFRWTTNYPASASNANVWVAYGWFIDDVKLTTLPDYDLVIDNDYWGSAFLSYYQVPNEQIAPIEFTAKVSNQGVSPVTNVQMNVDVNTGAFTGTSQTVSIPSMSSDSLVVSTTFTPSAIGTYSFTRAITSTEVDDVPANNTFAAESFQVTDHIYARDNGTANGYENNGGTAFEVGNLFDIWQDQICKGVNVRIASGTPAGTEVYARIYSIQNGDFQFEVESPTVALVNANLNNANFTIYLGTELQMIANTTYLVVVGTYGTGLRISNAGVSPDQTSFLLDGNDIVANTLYYTNSTPMVRLNFDPTLSIEENTAVSAVSTYPNPFNNATTVSFNLKNDADVAVTVTDLAGRVVYTAAAKNLSAGQNEIAIDGTSFNAGVYNVAITSNGATTTQRIVKK